MPGARSPLSGGVMGWLSGVIGSWAIPLLLQEGKLDVPAAWALLGLAIAVALFLLSRAAFRRVAAPTHRAWGQVETENGVRRIEPIKRTHYPGLRPIPLGTAPVRRHHPDISMRVAPDGTAAACLKGSVLRLARISKDGSLTPREPIPVPLDPPVSIVGIGPLLRGAHRAIVSTERFTYALDLPPNGSQQVHSHLVVPRRPSQDAIFVGLDISRVLLLTDDGQLHSALVTDDGQGHSADLEEVITSIHMDLEVVTQLDASRSTTGAFTVIAALGLGSGGQQLLKTVCVMAGGVLGPVREPAPIEGTGASTLVIQRSRSGDAVRVLLSSGRVVAAVAGRQCDPA